MPIWLPAPGIRLTTRVGRRKPGAVTPFNTITAAEYEISVQLLREARDAPTLGTGSPRT
jgi:hypothetical protein